MIGPSTKVIESLTFFWNLERAKVPASRTLSLPNAHMQLPRTCKRSALRVCALCCCFRRAFILCPCSLVVCAPGLSRCHVIHQKRNRIDSRLDVIAADAGARIVLTTSQIVSEIDSHLSHSPELATLRWVATDTLGEEDASRYREPPLLRNARVAAIYLRLHRESEGSDAATATSCTTWTTSTAVGSTRGKA